MKNFRKMMATVGLAGIMMVSNTFGGIIVTGAADGDADNPPPCTETSADEKGVILSDATGIIVTGLTGIIVTGLTGIIVTGAAGDTEPVNCGIIVTG
jgi:hypothetical protein